MIDTTELSLFKNNSSDRIWLVTCATSTNFLCFSRRTLVSCASSPSLMWVFSRASSSSVSHSTAWGSQEPDITYIVSQPQHRNKSIALFWLERNDDRIEAQSSDVNGSRHDVVKHARLLHGNFTYWSNWQTFLPFLSFHRSMSDDLN